MAKMPDAKKQAIVNQIANLAKLSRSNHRINFTLSVNQSIYLSRLTNVEKSGKW